MKLDDTIAPESLETIETCFKTRHECRCYCDFFVFFLSNRYADTSDAFTRHSSYAGQRAAAVLLRLLYIRYRWRATVGGHPASTLFPEGFTQRQISRVSLKPNDTSSVVRSFIGFSLRTYMRLWDDQSSSGSFIITLKLASIPHFLLYSLSLPLSLSLLSSRSLSLSFSYPLYLTVSLRLSSLSRFYHLASLFLNRSFLLPPRNRRESTFNTRRTLGCIAFEINVGRTLFPEDGAIHGRAAG